MVDPEQQPEKHPDAGSWAETRLATPRILIVGAGMSGLCLGIQLKRAGIESFTILEKSDDVGGTWLDNTYPNAGCDIPSFLYSFSFAPKYDWTQKFARQPEILEYFRDCARRFDLHRHIEFRTSVVRAQFDEERSVWNVETNDGAVRQVDIFVSAAGQLNRPKIPEIPGLDSFRGTSFHSARWDHAFDPAGKRVAVVGNGASAIQFLPIVAEASERTALFQRTPNWIHPLWNYRYPGWMKWMFRRVPLTATMHRWWIFQAHEFRFRAFAKSSVASWIYTTWLRWQMKRQVAPEMVADLIPDFPAGCKRILLANDFLQTVQRDDVDLVSSPIERITENSVVTADAEYPVDAIIFATGFDTSHFLAPMEITGRDSRTLADAWKSRPRTYLGALTAGFPNLFMLYGPNTNLGHNSIIFMVECQVNYILRCLKQMIADREVELEIPAEEVERFDSMLQSRLQQTVWDGDCSSWYKSAGSIINNWCATATAYWLRTRRADPRVLFNRKADRNGQQTGSPEESAVASGSARIE